MLVFVIGRVFQLINTNVHGIVQYVMLPSIEYYTILQEKIKNLLHFSRIIYKKIGVNIVNTASING